MIHLWVNTQKLLLSLLTLISSSQWRPFRSSSGGGAASSLSGAMLEGIWHSVRSR